MTPQVIPIIRPVRQLGEADDQFRARCEARAQDIFYPALRQFLAKIDETALTTTSDIVRADLAMLLDAIADYTPSKELWGK